MKTGGRVFERSAYFLDDYVDLLVATTPEESADENTFAIHDMCREMRALVKELNQLRNQWEVRRRFTSHAMAAEILCQMLKDWGTPGAVWYRPAVGRFRLCGQDYKSTRDEILCGVYLPSVTPESMADDLAFVIAESKQQQQEHGHV